MHEFSVMKQVVEAVLAEAKNRGSIEVKEVLLDVGALTFLGEEQMRFAYEVLTKDTPMEGSEIVIREVPPEVRCASCGYDGAVGYSNDQIFHTAVPIFMCPDCGGGVDIIKGRECTVRNIRMAIEEG